MAGNIQVTEGSGKYIATTVISEDALTKQVQRTIINDVNGSVFGVSGNPFEVSGNVTAIGIASVVGTVGVTSVVGAITLYAQPGSYRSGVSSTLTTTATTSILAAPGASLRNYITAIKVTNAATVAVIVDIKDSGANVLDTGYAAASGGGWSSSFPTPLRQGNTNASIDVVPRSQASVLVAISGFVAP